ncbi:MAG: rhodanese-related sulfurtransferase [Moorea sp. SIO2B7]|nr:rhodanese-related sulfurtransferase [Moorena sp. SIO2B7]
MSQQSFPTDLPSITVEELAVRLGEQDEELQLIDVRESQEVALAHLQGFKVLPLSQFEQWSDQIKTHFNPEVETLVMCHHGVRSAQMCYWLLNIGFTNVKNISGGIDAYSLLIDPSVPRY